MTARTQQERKQWSNARPISTPETENWPKLYPNDKVYAAILSTFERVLPIQPVLQYLFLVGRVVGFVWGVFAFSV